MTTDGRRRYQRDVERLLEQVRDRVHELRLIEARGARGPALATRKQALEQAREELAAMIAASSGQTRPPIARDSVALPWT